MKLKILLLCALCAARISFAQDSLQVTFSEQQDTLVKQRFVDRYENVFMTKVPTRNMFKVDLFRSELVGHGLYAGYEFKLLPALSLEVGSYLQTKRESNLFYYPTPFKFSQASLWTRVRARYYYNISERIRSGASANNFTGAYIGFDYDQSLILGSIYNYSPRNQGRLALLLGYQGRLLTHGHFDFNVGLFNRDHYYDEFGLDNEGFVRPRNFFISTQANIGLAFGDWKRKAKSAVCDLLVCNEQVSDQWKLRLPEISVGIKTQNVRLAGGYEHVLGKSSLSFETGLAANYRNSQTFATAYASAEAHAALRLYFLRNAMIRKGWVGGNLSGPYAEWKVVYESYMFESRPNKHIYNDTRPTERFFTQQANTLWQLGYQQRMFGKFYIDGSVGYGYSFFFKNNEGNYSSRLIRLPGVRSDLKIGFTF